MHIFTTKQKVLLLLLLSFVFFAGFVYFSYLVNKDIFNQFDFDTTVKIQDRTPRKVDGIFSVFSLLGNAEVSASAWVVLSILIFFKRWWLTFFSMSLFPFSVFLEVFGKLFVYHPAPPLFLYRGLFDFSLSKYYVHTEYSYPSGHVTRTAFLMLFLCLLFLTRVRGNLRKLVLAGASLGFLFIMMFSRIYLGEHWTSDVFGGFLLGGSFGIVAGVTTFKLKPAKQI